MKFNFWAYVDVFLAYKFFSHSLAPGGQRKDRKKDENEKWSTLMCLKSMGLWKSWLKNMYNIVNKEVKIFLLWVFYICYCSTPWFFIMRGNGWGKSKGNGREKEKGRLREVCPWIADSSSNGQVFDRGVG